MNGQVVEMLVYYPILFGLLVLFLIGVFVIVPVSIYLITTGIRSYAKLLTSKQAEAVPRRLRRKWSKWLEED